ncbi:helix-turn-helix transcriptional regulator [Aliigemmobacter aestuarii]|uniref:Helix-turn-helix transcriptional regulator n=1 Tax=Aliigemmobacter aestuarii TaxID=1445661 RepID=A0A4V3V0T3_9RHOB|nr:LuxR C-terminal-related transcriptional regulator [Gemmobacter aestuarii]THD85182.1 helix-turn-helix transcriptional regulator [Gemmobacter aestuarii]
MSGADLFPLIGAAIAAIGDERFPAALAGLLRAVAPYTYTVVFGYRGAARPFDLYDDFPASKRRIFVTDYQEGPYLLDPFYLAATRPVPVGLYRIRELAPDRFYQGEYFRNYYIQTGLAEEIGYFIDMPGDATVVWSLMRDEKPFSNRDMRALTQIRPVVEACVRRHWADLSDRFLSPSGGRAGHAMETEIEQSFHTFGEGLLTPREREIVEHTLKGHSAEAVGRILGISPGTVRIHRRNIYAKLRISSQGELFSKFIQTLGRI